MEVPIASIAPFTAIPYLPVNKTVVPGSMVNFTPLLMVTLQLTFMVSADQVVLALMMQLAIISS